MCVVLAAGVCSVRGGGEGRGVYVCVGVGSLLKRLHPVKLVCMRTTLHVFGGIIC